MLPVEHDLVVSETRGRGQRLEESLRGGDRLVVARHVFEENRELVAAEPCRDVDVSEILAQSLGDDREEAVTHVVTERVVHDLEAVQIE